MTSRKKLAKDAIKNSTLYSPAEVAYFERWLSERKKHKQELKTQAKKLQICS